MALVTGIPAAILGGSLALGGSWTVNQDGTLSGSDFSWGLFVVGVLALTLIAIFVTIPLYGSMVSIFVRRVREGRVAEYGDAFVGFRQYGQIVSTYLLIGIIVGVLSITFIGIPVAVYFGVLWVYAIVVVVDRRLGFGEATGASKGLVKGAGWWMTFLAVFVGMIVFGIISGVLGIHPGHRVHRQLPDHAAGPRLHRCHVLPGDRRSAARGQRAGWSATRAGRRRPVRAARAAASSTGRWVAGRHCVRRRDRRSPRTL